MNGKSKIWALSLLAAVLIAGGAAGVAVDRTVVRENLCDTRAQRRSDARDHRGGYLEWLSAELDLSSAQRGEIEGLVEANREAMSRLWRDTRPRFEELKSQLRAEIREVLNEDQRVAYEALLEEQSERRDRERKGRSHR